MRTPDPAAWRRWRGKALSDRLGPAPQELVRHIARVNESAEAAAATAAEASGEFLLDVRAAMAELPAAVRRPLESRLLGVYFARGLGCSAITDVVVHGAEVVGCVVVLDIDVLGTRKANAWATWKENKPFSSPGSRKLSVAIEVAAQDVRRNAIQFILLHEFGHVLGTAGQFLPDWWIAPGELKEGRDYAFLDLSWEIDDGKRIAPKPACAFGLRDSLVFYGSALLCEADAIDAYEALRATSFATLYAAGNPFDDFAESFALYVHTVLLGKPYEVATCGERPVELCDSLSIVARCAEKYSFVEDFLQAAAA
jgi:hypothetical protein